LELLPHNSIEELDYELAMHSLRENIWEKLLEWMENQTDNKDLQVKYKTLLNLPRAL
jgi:hypothetical protein